RIAEQLGGDRTESAAAAIRLAHSFPDARTGIGSGRSAWNLRSHGLEEDIEWCARENELAVVPRYVRAVGPAAEVTL
ncbi:MAG: 2-phosphosulfolactate phosphatase, partial [Gaiellaceae bacterium]|nr:2-phosphosulfolactate phosphatase [Gaiellaceae bacterium]